MAANILQQVILTGVFFMAGYDPVQGILPSEDVQTTAEGLICFETGRSSIINGGSYGIESSIIATFVLGITVITLYRIWSKKREVINGV